MRTGQQITVNSFLNWSLEYGFTETGKINKKTNSCSFHWCSVHKLCGFSQTSGGLVWPVSVSTCPYFDLSLLPTGEPHIDGEPGDLRFIIKQAKWVQSVLFVCCAAVCLKSFSIMAIIFCTVYYLKVISTFFLWRSTQLPVFCGTLINASSIYFAGLWKNNI